MQYADMLPLRSSSPLLARFNVAVEVAAHTIFTEPATTTNHDNRIAWAKRAFFQADAVQRYADMIRRLAVVSDATLQGSGEAISDVAIQSLVDSYVDQLATAGL
jgi:hypothetical protein